VPLPHAQPCPCSRRHSPPITAAETDIHHSPPKSWALRDPMSGDTRVKVRLCPNAHRLEHHVLNLFVAHDGEPPKRELRRFPRVLVDLARQAWADADHTLPLPRTAFHNGVGWTTA